MKTLKLLGLVALSALILIGLAGCPKDPEDQYLDGDIYLMTSSYGPYTTKLLTAYYDGNDEDFITYWWYKDGVPITPSSPTKHTPGKTEAGYYEVYVTREGYLDGQSGMVYISVAPDYVDYFGEWKMDYNESENSDWKTDSSNGGSFNEYVVIRDGSYRLESDKQSANTAGVQTNEFVYFTVNSWAVTSSASTVDNSYTSGYELTVNKTGGHGNYANPTSGKFSIYLNPSDHNKQVSDRSTIKRYYVRQSGRFDQ
jgi:hypothetical protein